MIIWQLLMIVQGCTRMNKKKKAQIKMGESIIILFIFFILVVFGLVFYASISKYTSGRDAVEAEEMNVENIQKELRFLSEIQCTESGNTRFDCYDIGKIIATQEAIQTHYDYYAQNVFLQTNISFIEVFPGNEEWSLYEPGFTEDDMLNIKGGSAFQIPVTLFHPIDDTYNFGYVSIMVYKYG
jgi:hypothetical protein